MARKMFNFPFEIDGETYWRSRSVTVVAYTYITDITGETYVLANKRGSGAPNCNGMWNVPCGYIDFNEDGQHAAARETMEETGLKLQPSKFTFSSVIFSKNSDQNINLHYTYVINEHKPLDYYKKQLSFEYMEPNEVEEIKFININDIDKYTWAFGQKTSIIEEFNKLNM